MFDVLLYNYAVEVIIDGIINFYYCTDNIDNAKEVFDNKIKNFNGLDRFMKAHVIVKLYDFDKDCNIEYYDSKEERT
jgi:hypothetical protein